WRELAFYLDVEGFTSEAPLRLAHLLPSLRCNDIADLRATGSRIAQPLRCSQGDAKFKLFERDTRLIVHDQPPVFITLRRKHCQRNRLAWRTLLHSSSQLEPRLKWFACQSDDAIADAQDLLRRQVRQEIADFDLNAFFLHVPLRLHRDSEGTA